MEEAAHTATRSRPAAPAVAEGGGWEGTGPVLRGSRPSNQNSQDPPPRVLLWGTLLPLCLYLFSLYPVHEEQERAHSWLQSRNPDGACDAEGDRERVRERPLRGGSLRGLFMPVCSVSLCSLHGLSCSVTNGNSNPRGRPPRLFIATGTLTPVTLGRCFLHCGSFGPHAPVADSIRGGGPRSVRQTFHARGRWWVGAPWRDAGVSTADGVWASQGLRLQGVG